VSLLPHHQDLIRASAISMEVAEVRGYRSVTRRSELEQLGFGKAQRNVPALLIPVWNVHGENGTHQARPDTPRVKDGKPLKYETPAGTHMMLDVPPLARPWRGDPHRPLFVTEGARKADAAVSSGLCCVALLGVWNWRGTTQSKHGHSVSVPQPTELHSGTLTRSVPSRRSRTLPASESPIAPIHDSLHCPQQRAV
jgi:hypothetical protein